MKIDKNTMKAFGVISLAAFAMTILPEISLAENVAEQRENRASLDSPWANTACGIVNWFTGGTGAAIATMAVIFLGLAAFFGKVTWGLALMFAVGIFAIFGASEIINAVSGHEGGCQAVAQGGLLENQNIDER